MEHRDTLDSTVAAVRNNITRRTLPSRLVNGVSFSSNHIFQIDIPATEAPAVLDFEVAADPLWLPPEWRAANVLFTQHFSSGKKLMELRLAGDEYWYWLAGGTCLKVSRERIRGFSRQYNNNPLALELEFMELGLALHLGLHGVPVFHASALEIDGAAVLLIAASGSGKSSLTAALLKHDCGFLSDDVAAVHGSEHLVWPSHSTMRLHLDSAEVLLTPDQHRPLHPARVRTKHITDVRDWGRVVVTPYPLRAIYFVDGQPGYSATRLTPVVGADAVRQLANNQLGTDSRPPGVRLSYLIDLVHSVPVKRISYPRSYEALDQVAEVLITDVQARQGSR